MLELYREAQAQTMLDLFELAAYGASLDAQDEDGRLPLVAAANASNRIETMKLLLVAGASLNGRNKSGLTPLMAIIKDQYHEGPTILEGSRVGGA